MADTDDGPQPFILTNSEKQSGLWMRLENHLQTHRDTLRKRNDGAMEPIPTATLRGQIAELTRLIDLGKDMPPIAED